MTKKKVKKNKEEKGVADLEYRAMELKYYGKSLAEIEEELKAEGHNVSWQVIGRWFREDGKLYKKFDKFCTDINEAKLKLSKQQIGSLSEESIKTIVRALKDDNVKLAERILTQTGTLEPETQPMALGGGSFSYEKLMITNEQSDTQNNNPRLKGQDDAVEVESEVIHQGTVED